MNMHEQTGADLARFVRASDLLRWLTAPRCRARTDLSALRRRVASDRERVIRRGPRLPRPMHRIVTRPRLSGRVVAYRSGRSALDAVNRGASTGQCRPPRGSGRGLSDYFGQIPHAELLKSVARRVSDGRMLGWVKAWLEMAVEEDDGKGGTRRTDRARRERKGTPQGAPISPLLSNLYMRRFILGWRVLAMPGDSRHTSSTMPMILWCSAKHRPQPCARRSNHSCSG